MPAIIFQLVSRIMKTPQMSMIFGARKVEHALSSSNNVAVSQPATTRLHDSSFSAASIFVAILMARRRRAVYGLSL